MCELDRLNPAMCSAVKRMTDLTLSVLGLIVLAPLLLGIVLAVYLKMGGPVLFRQVRLGYQRWPFTIYKFRTMRETRQPDDGLMPDAWHLTNLGRFLRKTSLDELPQLWNVIRGDMSLVGPRPQLPKYLSPWTPEQARRHKVRPGLTGWAQVNGRNAISWDETFRYDIWYVDHWSLGLDLKILLLTIITVIRCEGTGEREAVSVSPCQASIADVEDA